MITEIRISGKAAMDDLSILIPFLIFYNCCLSRISERRSRNVA